ncbi:hypothetical protein B0H19DRAFT_1168793 [Mycena capillaripes]|nr:hypothetical protein B0H19DRAFT_1168793 [Mycena capillaripes]
MPPPAPHLTPLKCSQPAASRDDSKAPRSDPDPVLPRSTPLTSWPTSRTASQEEHNPSCSDRLQKQLIETVKTEIGSQVWQFKDPVRISRILSPKTAIVDTKLDELEGYDCLVDQQDFSAALEEAQWDIMRPSRSF